MYCINQTHFSKGSLRCVGSLVLGHLCYVDDLDDVQVVEADGQGQPAKEHGAEQEAVLVRGVVGGQVVQVEDADAEHCEVGTDAQIRHDAH